MIEGKLANRCDIKIRMGAGNQAICEKCQTLFSKPEVLTVGSKKSGFFICQSYLATEHFVYEARSGVAVCYCSEYCAKKHNHRFKKGDS